MSKNALFIIVNFILATYFFDNWSNGNTTSRVLPVASILLKGTYNFEKIDSTTDDKSIINGKHYTDKAPLPTLLFIPIAFALEKIGWVDVSNNDFRSLYAWSGFIFGTTPFIFLILLTYLRTKELWEDNFNVLIIVLPWFGSFIFSYSSSMYSHVFAGLLLIIAYRLLQQSKLWLSGLMVGALFLTEYPLALVGIIWGLQLWFQNGFKKAVIFGLGGLPAILLIGYYNYEICGNAFTLLYKYVDMNYAFMHKDYGFGSPSLKIATQLLFGQYKGLFLYCPIFIFILYFGIKNWLSKPSCGFGKVRSVMLDPIVMPFLTIVLLVSSYGAWWGGWAYGPRHLIPVVALMLYFYLPILAGSKIRPWVAGTIMFCGLFVGFLAKFTHIYSVPTEVDYPISYLVTEFFVKGTTNPNNLLTYFFQIDARVAIMVYVLIFGLSTFVLKKRC